MILHLFSLPMVLAVILAVLSGCAARSEVGNPGDRPAHHSPDGFLNIHENPEHRFLDFLKWRLGLGPDEESAIPPDEVPEYKPDIVQPDLNAIKQPDPNTIQVTWIGHATFLIQTGGINILTDPMYSKRASPVSFMGPKRLVPPGVPFTDLPEIHAVVITHDHYDHLDASTIRRLGNKPRYFVPLGLASWFRKKGIDNVQELDWWSSAMFGPLRFHSVPVQHFSSRSLSDRNERLWAGWVIETGAGKIFFSGCTGYAPQFAEIGKKLGPIRLSFIPVGGYVPRWFMRSMHVDPTEAVRIHQDLGSAQSIGTHWGTFELTDEPLAEPPLYLRKALKEAGVAEEKFIIMKFGETRVFHK